MKIFKTLFFMLFSGSILFFSKRDIRHKRFQKVREGALKIKKYVTKKPTQSLLAGGLVVATVVMGHQLFQNEEENVNSKSAIVLGSQSLLEEDENQIKNQEIINAQQSKPRFIINNTKTSKKVKEQSQEGIEKIKELTKDFIHKSRYNFFIEILKGYADGKELVFLEQNIKKFNQGLKALEIEKKIEKIIKLIELDMMCENAINYLNITSGSSINSYLGPQIDFIRNMTRFDVNLSKFINLESFDSIDLEEIEKNKKIITLIKSRTENKNFLAEYKTSIADIFNGYSLGKQNTSQKHKLNSSMNFIEQYQFCEKNNGAQGYYDLFDTQINIDVGDSLTIFQNQNQGKRTKEIYQIQKTSLNSILTNSNSDNKNQIEYSNKIRADLIVSIFTKYGNLYDFVKEVDCENFIFQKESNGKLKPYTEKEREIIRKIVEKGKEISDELRGKNLNKLLSNKLKDETGDIEKHLENLERIQSDLSKLNDQFFILKELKNNNLSTQIKNYNKVSDFYNQNREKFIQESVRMEEKRQLEENKKNIIHNNQNDHSHLEIPAFNPTSTIANLEKYLNFIKESQELFYESYEDDFLLKQLRSLIEGNGNLIKVGYIGFFDRLGNIQYFFKDGKNEFAKLKVENLKGGLIDEDLSKFKDPRTVPSTLEDLETKLNNAAKILNNRINKDSPNFYYNNCTLTLYPEGKEKQDLLFFAYSSNDFDYDNMVAYFKKIEKEIENKKKKENNKQLTQNLNLVQEIIKIIKNGETNYSTIGDAKEKFCRIYNSIIVYQAKKKDEVTDRIDVYNSYDDDNVVLNYIKSKIAYYQALDYPRKQRFLLTERLKNMEKMINHFNNRIQDTVENFNNLLNGIKKKVEEKKKKEKQLEELEKRLEKERLEKERLEKERLEKERLEKERLENEKLENEKLENEKLEKEQSENRKDLIESASNWQVSLSLSEPKEMDLKGKDLEEEENFEPQDNIKFKINIKKKKQKGKKEEEENYQSEYSNASENEETQEEDEDVDDKRSYYNHNDNEEIDDPLDLDFDFEIEVPKNDNKEELEEGIMKIIEKKFNEQQESFYDSQSSQVKEKQQEKPEEKMNQEKEVSVPIEIKKEEKEKEDQLKDLKKSKENFQELSSLVQDRIKNFIIIEVMKQTLQYQMQAAFLIHETFKNSQVKEAIEQLKKATDEKEYEKKLKKEEKENEERIKEVQEEYFNRDFYFIDVAA